VIEKLNTAGTLVTRRKPPKTHGLPLLGALPAFLRHPFDFLLAARERYGDIYTLDAGPLQLVLLNHPRQIEYMLRDNAQNYVRAGVLYEAARSFLGNGLAVSDGAFWLRQRRMMQPHFHYKRLATLTDLMVATIGEELGSWGVAARSGAPFNLAPAFNRITMHVVVRTLFGTALTNQEADTLGAEMAFALDHFFLDALAGTLPAWLPLPGARRLRQARATVDAALYDMIGRVRRGEGGEDTLMAMLLHMVDAETGAQMTDQQLRDEAVTLVLAGYETTSLALSWTCQLLTQHPEVMAKLQAEIDALGGRALSFVELRSLSYASMVIQESMRLYPPAWFYGRAAVADDEIDGFAIEAGTIVGVLPYTVHRHPELWEQPERFDPERFRPERSASRPKSAWMGFGLGQHQCIGRDFALMEAQLVLAMLLQRYHIATVPGQVATPQLSATLRPKGGLFVNIRLPSTW
jgi:cytochrome P450